MRKLDELLEELQIALNEKQPFQNVTIKKKKVETRTGELTQLLKYLEVYELSPLAKLVFLAIHDNETITVRDIKLLVGLSKPTLQKNLVSLISSGMIKKLQNGIYTSNLQHHDFF